MMKDKYKVLIRSCWALLLVCFGIKIFGGNLFEIVCENERFISLCNYIDTHNIIKYIIYCVISLPLNILSVLAMMKQKTFNRLQIFIFIPLMIAMSLIGWYSYLIQLILNIITIFILPIVFSKKWKRVLIGNLLILAFQMISMITKNIGNIHLNEELSLIAIILQLDSIIMVALYYLYSIKNAKELK